MNISKQLRIPGPALNLGVDLSFPPNLSLGLPGITSNVIDDPSFVQQVVAAGAIPEEDVETMEQPSNQTITFSYSILPWADNTHIKIQEWMYLFAQRYLDSDRKIYNVIPFWKLSLECFSHYHNFVNATAKTSDHQEFERLTKIYGDEILYAYDAMPKIFEGNGDLATYKRLALRPEFRYLTSYGLTETWAYIGTCLSKQEATGAFAHVNHLDNTSFVSNIGVAAGGTIPGLNIFGGKQLVYQGTKLWLIGRRVTTAKGTPGPFRFEPYASRDREYPPRILTTYIDWSGRICRSIIIEIGTCKSNRERDPSQNQIKQAMGYTGDAQSCYEACGFLPKIDIVR